MINILVLSVWPVIQHQQQFCVHKDQTTDFSHMFQSDPFSDRCVPCSSRTMEGKGGREVADPLKPKKSGFKQETEFNQLGQSPLIKRQGVEKNCRCGVLWRLLSGKQLSLNTPFRESIHT